MELRLVMVLGLLGQPVAIGSYPQPLSTTTTSLARTASVVTTTFTETLSTTTTSSARVPWFEPTSASPGQTMNCSLTTYIWDKKSKSSAAGAVAMLRTRSRHSIALFAGTGPSSGVMTSEQIRWISNHMVSSPPPEAMDSLSFLKLTLRCGLFGSLQCRTYGP